MLNLRTLPKIFFPFFGHFFIHAAPPAAKVRSKTKQALSGRS